MKKTISLILAIVMLLSLGITSFADGEEGGPFIPDIEPPYDPDSEDNSITSYSTLTTAGGTSTTIMSLSTEAATFSVQVPTTLPVSVAADGTVSVATGDSVAIENNSNGPVKVTGVEITAQNSWEIADFGSSETEFQKYQVNDKKFGMQLKGKDVFDEDYASTFGSIAANGNQTFTYAVKVAPQGTALSNETIANIVFTIGWDLATVNKTALSPAPTMIMSDYSLSNTPNTPSVSNNPENTTVTYYYSTVSFFSGPADYTGILWDTEHPPELQCGTYFMRAVLAESANYTQYVTAQTTFTVTP